MTEEGTPPAEGQAPVETPVEAPAAEAAPSLISADGSLAEGWQEQAPEGYEDLKGDQSLNTIKKIWDLSKSYVHVRKQVPVDKMPRPNDRWTEAEWDDFYTIAGRPETPQDYGEYKAPEGWDDTVMPWKQVESDWQETFFKIGLNKKQTDALKAMNDKHTEILNASMTRISEENQHRIHDALQDEWGNAYNQKTFRAEKAVERGANGDDALNDHVLDKMKADPQLMKWMANMEDQFSEHETVERHNIETPGDLQEQIDALRKDPAFLHDDLRVRQPIINKVNRLTERLLREKQPA